MTEAMRVNGLSFDDPRWKSLKAGYGIPIDLRPLLRRLELGGDTRAAWSEVWQELFHQGDVGEGSFVAVPHLLRIHEKLGLSDWNTYAIVCSIELARDSKTNPEVPDWARPSYDSALAELARTGLRELPQAMDAEVVRSILALLALVKGARTYARILNEFSEDELLELEEQAFGGDD